MSALPPSFFNRPVLTVAPALLGKTLCRERNGSILRIMITEVEAYDGENDLACHARFGKTKRNAVMFGPAAHWYVYLCYGMHRMLNIVTGEEGYPAAILIRGGTLTRHTEWIPLEGKGHKLRNAAQKRKTGASHHAPFPQGERCIEVPYKKLRLPGPGILTRALHIDGSLNGKSATRSSGLWIEEGITVTNKMIERLPRIGVGYAGKWAKKKWRFVLDGTRRE